MPPISVAAHGPPTSSAFKFLSRTCPSSQPTSEDTPLLQAIKTALRGSDTENVFSIQTATFFTGNDANEREVTWNAHTVVMSYGGVMVKKWNFQEEGESIQWACLGELEQIDYKNTSTSHSTTNYTSTDNPPSPLVPNDRLTFGPFTRTQINTKPDPGVHEKVPGIFVFLRSIGKIYLLNGMDYTFSLPFIVRKAWPISPHGVIIQRVLEPTEIVEADLSGDAVLPTIFSVTSPFAEAAAVGLTAGILGPTPDDPAALIDEDENSTRPLKSIPPTEMIIWASHCNIISDAQILVTINVEKHQLSVWRYVYIKPKDTPAPLRRAQTTTSSTNSTQKRQSMSGVGSRRTSALFDGRDRLHPMSPNARTQEATSVPGLFELPEVPSLSSLPGMAPALSSTTTMASLVSGGTSQSRTGPVKGRRNSLSRNDLSMNMDRMALGGRLELDITLTPIEHGRMKAAYWMENLVTHSIGKEDAQSWRNISASIFDNRWDGQRSRCLLSICLPASQSLLVFSLLQKESRTMEILLLKEMPACAATSLRATRKNVWDLLIVKPLGELSLLTHGLCELPMAVRHTFEIDNTQMDVDQSLFSEPEDHGTIVSVREAQWGTTIITYKDGWKSRIALDIYAQDVLVTECFQLLALILPVDVSFALHRAFLENWSAQWWSTTENVEFGCFTAALYAVFGLGIENVSVPSNPWLQLAQSSSHARFREDPALRSLRTPPSLPTPRPVHTVNAPHPLLCPLLYGLHMLGEHLRLLIHRHSDLLRFAPVLCRIALSIRPEWADYWKRLVPDAISVWPSPITCQHEHLDDRIPVWPPDISAILYGRISTPDWKVPWHDLQHIVTRFQIIPSMEYGVCDPLRQLHELSLLFNTLSDSKVPESQKRAENVIYKMVTQNTADLLYLLPLGISAPLREAARTCQLAPPGNWPLEAYRSIGRNDLAASATQNPDILFSDGYKSRKDFINLLKLRETIGEITAESRALAGGEIDSVAISGVDLNLKEFTDVRFGQDRRLEEVSRMLCSSTIPSIKSLDRPELSEHDQTKEHQNQAMRVAERTFALPYGRAMFTFGSIPLVTREAYVIPKIEYTVRVQPLNILITPEVGKVSPESVSWGEFHNGVAAGLRVSPTATGVESSWIAFNKPSDLSPEHAGFLLGLGLTGHLKEMLTWHTFAYLTPKHDLTSIGVLLGLSAANVGSGNQHVTKLLAVHTPALLPTPTVDLNVSLLTQAAGLSGVGLLYLGTKNRRMAEVCLNQISRRDLVQPDLSNEYREAYTYASALAFGMIVLGKGTIIPADLGLLKRLSILIHGDASRVLGNRTTNPFDINLTSPAASIALGLMYLRTGRKDIADILTIPDTVLSLNAIQPTFLLIRTIARSLILWDSITPSNEWLMHQVPQAIREGMETRKSGKPIDDSMELAYYNILSGCCFVIGLKYAGTARQEAYQLIVRHFDLFSRMAYTNGPTFDHKIKRSAVRDGLNLISISLCMVMAGTGEITCLRRLRYAYGMSQQMMYHAGFKYGVHISTHMALGLLFLGGGRYTLGTSDAAIACMVTAFFPRFHHVSSDNKSFLQALRHLWVLAVEPRCLIARDVDTNEIVYLPVKITMSEADDIGTTQLISPTLIPDMDKLVSIRVDTPRYWPFYLDTATHPRHKEALLRSQTLYVKRRTAFLSYTEDPRGSRSLFVRSGSSSGDSATLDFPQLTDTKTHPAGDLSEFITSFSNNVLFLAFADHFARSEGETPEEKLFHTYCHAALLDSILQDKPQTLQSHLTLYKYRNMSPKSRYFHLQLQDLRFTADFYSKVYERRFSGRAENNPRPPLIRDTTVLGALHALDRRLDAMRTHPKFVDYLGGYARGDTLPETKIREGGIDIEIEKEGLEGEVLNRYLAWYLLRNGVPVSTLLVVLRALARDAHSQCLRVSPPEGTLDGQLLDVGIKEVLHATGTRMTAALGSGWSVRSLNEIIEAWKIV